MRFKVSKLPILAAIDISDTVMNVPLIGKRFKS